MPELLQLALLIAILLPAGKLVASLCTRFGIPPIIGELMVGIAAGPGGLNLFHLDLFRRGHAINAFMLLSQVGGLFVLAFLTASASSASGDSFGFATQASGFLQHHFPLAAHHPLIVQMSLITLSVAIFFLVGYGAAKRWLDPLILQMRRLSANE